MIRRALTLATCALLSSPLWAAPAGLRVLAVKAPNGEARFSSKRAGESGFFSVFPGQQISTDEELQTGPGTVAALALPDGSRLAFAASTHVRVQDASATHLLLHKGAVWSASAGSSGGSHKLQITSDGRRFTVRGTEFTLEGGDGQLDNLAVLEGAVDVSGPRGSEEGTASAGDSWTEAGGNGWTRRHVDPAELRREVAHGPLELAFEWLSDELGALRSDLTSASRKWEQLQNLLNGGKVSNADLSAPFGAAWSNLAKAETPPPGTLKVERDQPGRPRFSWPQQSGAAAYALFVSSDPDGEQVAFSLLTRSSVAVYPATGRPLPAGPYHWFVVPLDENDRPRGTAQRSHFEISP